MGPTWSGARQQGLTLEGRWVSCSGQGTQSSYLVHRAVLGSKGAGQDSGHRDKDTVSVWAVTACDKVAKDPRQ